MSPPDRPPDVGISRRPEELPKSSGHAPQSKEERELPFWTAQNFPGTVSWRTPISG